jgi:hypothetical protein
MPTSQNTRFDNCSFDGTRLFSLASNASQSGALQQSGPVPSGTTLLTLTGTFQTDGTDTARIALSVMNRDGTVLEQKTLNNLVTSSEGWQAFELALPVPVGGVDQWEVALEGARVDGGSGGGLKNRVRVVFDALSLTPSSRVHPDFDEDGDIDGADLLKWQRGETPNPWGNEDLAAWQSHFGQSQVGLQTHVPEASTCTAMIVGLVALFLRRGGS